MYVGSDLSEIQTTIWLNLQTRYLQLRLAQLILRSPVPSILRHIWCSDAIYDIRLGWLQQMLLSHSTNPRNI